MSKFKDISIRNFRGIESVEVKDLGKINLFLGKNNSGKTTILESFFLLSGLSNHDLPMRINRLRSNEEGGFDKLKYLYFNADMTRIPHLDALMDDGKVRNLEFMVKENLRMKHMQGVDTPAIPTTDDNGIAAQCLSMNFYSGAEKSNKIFMKSEVCFLNNGEVQEQKMVNYNETMAARFITAYPIVTALRDEMSSLIKKNKKQDVIDLARIFDDKINNIEVLPDSLYVGFEDVEELLPIGLCGEGLKKFLYILVSAANASSNVLLIDEIENGIHFSVYHHLWKSILRLASVNDLQIMITTHNIETVAALSAVLEMDDVEELVKSTVRVYTVARTSTKGLQTYRYVREGLKNVLANNIEIRK